MRNIGTYLNVHLASNTDWYDCVVDNASCDNLTCTAGEGSVFSFLLSPCDQAVTIAHVPANDSSSTAFRNTFRRTGMLALDNNTHINVLINFNATLSMFGLQVSHKSCSDFTRRSPHCKTPIVVQAITFRYGNGNGFQS
jgi:hypothetical protein